MNSLIIFLSALLLSCSGQHLPTVMLKQAAESLLQTPLTRKFQESGLTRLEIPEAEDLLIRRLQGELSRRIEDNWRSINDPQRFQILKEKGAAIQILKSFQYLNEKMEKLEKDTNIPAVEKALNDIKLDPDDSQLWLNVWDDLRRKVGTIAQLYNYFSGYIDKIDTTEESTLQDFASSIAMSSVEERSMQNMLNNFHEAVSPADSQKRHLFPYFHSILSKGGSHLCSMSQSPHQLLYNLYNIIALTEIRGYAMLQFSYMMLRIYDKGNFTVEAESAKNNFEEQALEKMKSMLMVLPSLTTQYHMCDPLQHKEGDTYLEITKLLQGFIENEVDMNERQSCQAECSAYTITENKGCYQDQFCAKQPKCNGRMFDCQFFHADAWVCMSQSDGQGSSRRYDWVEYEDGTLLGNKGQCVNKIKVDSWWRYVFYHCSYCLCKCEEISDDSDRYWSLLPAMADTDNNKIMTGVRFIKRGRVIMPQVEQATALPEGGVDDTTREWVEPSEVFSNITKELSDKNNTKVFTMTYEQRAMDMDTLTAPPGHVLTGIKLRNLGGHLNLEIQVTPVNFTGGNLLTDRSTWVANDNTPATDKPRNLVPIVMPDIPTNYHGTSKVDTDTDQYIQFDASSAYKDVSQTTIPFIDAQPVAPYPASWLGGAGLYHKGRIGYGGFVGFKVFTYDFSRHIVPTSNTNPTLRYEFVKAEDV